jgi:ribonuclease D
MTWQLIEDDQTLHRVLEDASDCTAVMVDTEFMRRNTFFPQVALVQLCFDIPGQESPPAWLVDPLKIDDTAPLEALLANPKVIKVLHSASEDLEVFQCWLGTLPAPLFDSQRAAALVDMGFGLGYRALVNSICDVDLPKGEQRSDWLQRPLTDAQSEYAAQDVTYLLRVWRDLYARCQQAGKLEWVLADGLDALAGADRSGEEYYKRIKGGWKLDQRQLGALVALSRWREDTARRRDKPRSWIIDDKACLEIARNTPADLNELKATTELPAPLVRRHGEEILDILSEQRGMPDEQLPAPLPAPLSAAQRDQLKRLKSAARELAAGLSIAPEALLQSKDYELLLREAAGENVAEPAHWQGWRAQSAIAPLRASLVK